MTRLRQLRFWTLAVILAASSLRCGENIKPPEATDIEMVDGDGQTGIAGAQLAKPLIVLVTDQSGNPVQGVSVQWAVQNGGSVSSQAVQTGSDGRASVSRVLGSQLGEQTTTAAVSGLTGSPVTFLAIASDGQSPILSVLVQPSGNAQSGVKLAVQPVIQLQDPSGNDRAQSGVQVTAAIAGTSGTLGGTVTRPTDDKGRATFDDLQITGPAGNYNLRFTAPGTTQTLSASITLSAAAGGIVITNNPPTSALDGEVFDPIAQPVVQVTDAGGNPVGGIPVTAATASGTLEGTTTATTDAAGVARFGDLGIRGTGAHTLVFTAGAFDVTSSAVNVTALSQEATTGKWGPVVNWDIVPLHISLLPSGKVFAWGKRDVSDTVGKPRIWDPSTGAPPSGLPPVAVTDMLFCAGQTIMPDGRLMVAGGHHMDDAGIKVTYFFSPDGASQKGPSMAHGRWYPTLTVLADGRVLSMGGRDETQAVVKIPEIFENGAWTELPGAANVEIPYYPRNFVAPNGRIFYAGERVRSRWFDVDLPGVGGRGKWTDGPNHIWPYNRDYGTAVMYEPGKILFVGGGGNVGWGRIQTPDPTFNQVTATAEKIDLNESSPVWQSAGSMSQPRRHLNSTVLPDGQVLITGGTKGAGFVDINQADAVKAAEIWNPATGQWTTLASANKMRVYHSVSLLLPDGSVLHGSSGDAMANPTTPVPPERNHEIFFPPYLFKGARPVITSAPAEVGYGQTFSVETPNAAQVTQVRWIRLGSVTHAFDASARANTLTFAVSGGNVQVTAPMLPSLAPPGYYQLFILNRNGVPSIGKMVHIVGS